MLLQLSHAVVSGGWQGGFEGFGERQVARSDARELFIYAHRQAKKLQTLCGGTLNLARSREAKGLLAIPNCTKMRSYYVYRETSRSSGLQLLFIVEMVWKSQHANKGNCRPCKVVKLTAGCRLCLQQLGSLLQEVAVCSQQSRVLPFAGNWWTRSSDGLPNMWVLKACISLSQGTQFAASLHCCAAGCLPVCILAILNLCWGGKILSVTLGGHSFAIGLMKGCGWLSCRQ